MSEEARTLVLDEGIALVERYLNVSVDQSSDATLVAAQLLLSTVAVNSKLPLQQLMDMLLKNVPAMYEVAFRKMQQREQVQ